MGTHSRLLTAALTVALLGVPALAAPAPAQRATDPSRGSISIKASPAALVDGPITVKGVVSLKRAGIKVGLQRRAAGGWRNLSQTKTTAGGRYRLTGSLDSSGSHQLRVIRLPWLTTSAKSHVVTVDVYQWQRLDEADDFDDGPSFDQPADIGGVGYPNSITIDADSQGTVKGGFFQLDLTDQNCAALDLTAGALDGNAATSEVGLEIKLDNQTLVEKRYRPGESDHLTLDLRGGSTLRVEGQVVLAGPQGKVALGSPRLLCAG